MEEDKDNIWMVPDEDEACEGMYVKLIKPKITK